MVETISVIVEKLSPSTENLWRDFAARHPRSLFYVSLEYKELLERTLGAEPHYLIAINDGRCRGILPAFISLDRGGGRVLNSLPYYGSNGGCLTDGSPQVARKLLAAFVDAEQTSGCLSSTLICSPLEAAVDIYDAELQPQCHDMRIGQLTELPPFGDDLEGRLFALYDESARRNVRKARKSAITWSIEDSRESIAFLAATHDENIRAIGGLPKTATFFDDAFLTIPSTTRRLYVARLENQPVAALLVFRFGCAVEYFTPAIVSEFRSIQPLALLVHEAMREAARDGFRYWNWGGTWATQDGVYRFKKKWGATDMPYRYFTRLRDLQIKQRSKEQILTGFPGFYVLPFDCLSAQSNSDGVRAN